MYKRYLPRPSLFRMLARLSALLFSVPEIDLIAMETNRRQLDLEIYFRLLE